MRAPTARTPLVSKLTVSLVCALLAGVVGIVALPSAQAVDGGRATCDALDVALFADSFLDISGGTDDVVAPDPENSTNTAGTTGEITVPGIGGAVTIDLVRCDATRAQDLLRAESAIAGGDVTGIPGEVALLSSVTSQVSCPAAGTGNPSASSSASLTVGGEVIELDSEDGMVADEANIDVSISGIAEGILNVAAETRATTDDGSAEATGLELTLTFSGAILGESVLLTLGTVTFAETSCTAGAPGEGPPSTPAPPPPTPPPPTPPPTMPPGATLPPTR